MDLSPSDVHLGVSATSREDKSEECVPIALCFVSQGLVKDL